MRTDGFFAAYAVYIAVVLVASALRVVVLPQFARARVAGELGREFASWALALAVVLVPAVVGRGRRAPAVAGALTSRAAGHARGAAALLPWLIPAAAAQIDAGVAASALAALDDYGTAAFAYGLGGGARLRRHPRALVEHSVAAFGVGARGERRRVARRPARRPRRAGRRGPAGHARSPRRLRDLVEGVSLPFALQGLYVIGYRFTTGLGTGKPTTFSYAYLIAALLVAVTATSIALVSSVPLSRGDLTPARAGRHVVAASWLSLAVIAAAAGVFALAGERVARWALGSQYGGGTGTELGRLVVGLAPWMVVSVALSVAFPLLFVRGRARWLPLLAVGVLLLHVAIEWLGRSLFELAGIVAGMAVTTAVVLVVLLAALGTVAATLRGLLTAAVVCGVPAVACFGVAGSRSARCRPPPPGSRSTEPCSRSGGLPACAPPGCYVRGLQVDRRRAARCGRRPQLEPPRRHARVPALAAASRRRRLPVSRGRQRLERRDRRGDQRRVPRQLEAIENPENAGFAGGNNVGIERALELGAGFVLVLNNDVEVEPGCIAPPLVAEAARARTPVRSLRRSSSPTRPT